MPSDNVGVRLREVEKDVYIHAALAWESPQCMAIIAFMPLEAPTEDFQKFFSREVELQKEAVREGPSFRPDMNDTPLRIMSAAESANLTSPPAWKARKVLAEA